MVTISQLTANLDCEIIGKDKVVSGLSYDSRQIKPGELFLPSGVQNRRPSFCEGSGRQRSRCSGCGTDSGFGSQRHAGSCPGYEGGNGRDGRCILWTSRAEAQGDRCYRHQRQNDHYIFNQVCAGTSRLKRGTNRHNPGHDRRQSGSRQAHHSRVPGSSRLSWPKWWPTISIAW